MWFNTGQKSNIGIPGIYLVYLCHLSNLETDDYVNRENAVLSPAKAAFACFVVYSDVVFKVNVSLLTVSASRMDD